jgi:predicted acyl esterase
LVEDPGTGGGAQEYAQKPGCQPGVMLGMSDLSGDFTEFWRARDARLGVANVRAATLAPQGHLDDRVPSFAQAGFFDRLPPDTPRAGLFGVWNHEFPDRYAFASNPGPVDWERADWLDMVVAWYDRFLKGLDTGVEDWPVVQIQGTDGQWRAEDDWPNPGGEPGQLALGPAGALGARDPAGSTAYVEAMVETTVADYPPGTAAVFETPRLERRLEVHGTPVLDAWVSLNRPDAHLAAKLEVLGPDGEPTLALARAVGLRSARHLDPLVDGRFVQERGRPAPVNQPVRIPLRFNPTSLVLPAGGSLRLTVAGSVMVNDGLHGVQNGLGAVIEGPSQPSLALTRVTLLHDCDHPSALRFEMPSGADLLNVREKDEPAGAVLADNRPYASPVADGGIAMQSVCGHPPLAPGPLLAGE